MAKDTNRAGRFQEFFQGEPQYDSRYYVAKTNEETNYG